MEEALAHIETRVNVLHQLSDHATQLAEDVDPTSRTQAAAVVDLVADTLQQLLVLQQHILDARLGSAPPKSPKACAYQARAITRDRSP